MKQFFFTSNPISLVVFVYITDCAFPSAIVFHRMVSYSAVDSFELAFCFSPLTEAEYAFKLGKDIVPLQLQAGYRPDGWLGILTGAKHYFEFIPDNSFEDKMKELIRELGERGKAVS